MAGRTPTSPQAETLSLLSEGLVLLGLLLLGFCGSQMLTIGIIYAWFGFETAEVVAALAAPEAMGTSGRYLLLGIQGLSSLGTFALPAVLLVFRFKRQNLWAFSPRPIVDNLQLVWAILLVPALAPLLELTITWNKSLVLPGMLHGLEEWAQAKEAQLAKLTEYLIAFSDFGQFLTGLLVIAVLPAICEELLFRGTIQPYIQRLTSSPHRAIWITAFVFSAIHLQFYGFVPRLLLGALFGYLYYWSGNISIPILGHFVNNGITVVMSYLSQQGQPDLDPDNLPAAPLYVLLLSIVAGAAVLYRFYMRYFVPYHSPSTWNGK